MTSLADGIALTQKVLPYFGTVPQSAELMHYAIKGFEIPTLPALPPEHGQMRDDLVKSVLYRFRSYISELHSVTERRSIALQFMSHPELSNFRNRVRCYVLCRTAHAELAEAKTDVADFAQQAMQTFPQEGLFAYGGPRWLNQDDLDTALFKSGEVADVKLAEIRKYEDVLTIWRQPSLHYVPHRLWADQQRDPWLSLIETLASLENQTAIRIELTPVRLITGQGLDFISLAGRWFDVINEDLDRKASQGEQVRTDGVVTEEMMRQDEVSRAASNAATISYIKRGRHIYEKLTTYCDSVFSLRVTLAAKGHLSDAVVGSVRAAMSTPPADDPQGAIGWMRPDIVAPPERERADALMSLRYMTQSRWGRSPPNEAHKYKIDLRSVVTPDEAVSLFHMPIYDRMGQTSAVSTAETPFVIPPETLDKKRFKEDTPEKKGDQTIMIGYMYQREKLLEPKPGLDNGLPFYVTVNDLMKPSLLVGAPGSGKTNLAFSLLIQLWKKYRIPFLVLDPSTGQEFRMLMRHEKLADELVVYTAGDLDGLPLRFNPFSVPPGVTVRNHTTRILAAFRAAFTMFDPVPAIYEGALERIYTDARYTGDAPIMSMEQKGDLSSPAPTLVQFAQAIQDELTEKALTLYKGSAESIGVIRGASTIRVNAIGKKIGHIINVAGNNGDFLQKMLKQPTVIEMGALGDSSNIALVMAFFLSQLAGNVEYAFHEDEKRQHIIFIEEAHRLLGAGDEGVAGKSAEDLNMMLAEVRKFGQGILVMDQRPSSLVGGVLDNAYVKILTRLSDRPGFERLSDELNLNEAQQRYARTRLKVGEAIVLDRDAGQPVLMRSENAKGDLEKIKMTPADAIARMNANAARVGLMPPPAVPYIEPVLPGTEAAVADAKSDEWLAAVAGKAMTARLGQLRNDSTLYHAAKSHLEGAAPDIDAAKAAVDAAIAREPSAFDRIADEMRNRLAWAMVGKVAEESATRDVQSRVQDLRTRPPAASVAPAAAAPSTSRPPAQAASVNAAQPPIDDLSRKLSKLVEEARSAPKIWWGAQPWLRQDKPDIPAALKIVQREMQKHRAAFDKLDDAAWQKALQTIVDKLAAETMDDAILARVRARPMK